MMYVPPPLQLSLSFSQVVDSNTDRRLGHLQMEVKDLLREPELEVHETPYQLKDSGPISKIILSMQLRVGCRGGGGGTGRRGSASGVVSVRTSVADGFCCFRDVLSI